MPLRTASKAAHTQKPQPRLGRLMLVGVAWTLASCTCGRAGVEQRNGELVVVTPGKVEALAQEATLLGPTVPMGEQGVMQVKLRNVGLGPLTLTRLTLTEGSTAYSVEVPADPQLAVEQELDLSVTFTPPQDTDATASSVVHRGVLVVEAQGALEGQGVVTVELLSTALAGDCLVPAVIDFGEVPVDVSVQLDVPLVNHSQFAQTTTVSEPGGDDAVFFTSLATSVDLASMAETSVPVLFHPLEARAYAATLTMKRSARCPSGVSKLIGTASTDALTWEPTLLDFGRVPLNDTAHRSVVVRSKAGVALPVGGAVASGVGFLLDGQAPTSIPPSGAVTLSVGCKPESIGLTEGRLTVTVATTPAQVLTIPLKCFGGGPRMHVAPAQVAFGIVPVRSGVTQQASQVRRLSVQNVGNPPPNDNLKLGRGNGQLPYFSLGAVTGDVDDWQVQVPSTYDQVLGLPAVPGQNTVELQVIYTPKRVGRSEADLYLYSNDAVEPVVRVRLSADARSSNGCRLVIEQSALNFGELPQGAVVDGVVTLRSVSSETCQLTGLELATGSDGYQLVAPPMLPATFSAAQSLPIRVRLTVPANAADGAPLLGALRLFTTDVQFGDVTIPLSAHASQCLVIAPERIDFGTVRLGCSSPARRVYAYNVCSAPVTLRGLSTLSAPFAYSATPTLPATLAPSGAPVTFEVKYVPGQSLGMHRSVATLSVDVAGASRTIDVELVGNATTDGIQVDTFEQPAVAKADILFTIDDSCSMADEQGQLATNLASFLSFARMRNVQYQLGVTTTDDDVGRGLLVGSPANPKVLTSTTPNLERLFADKVQVGTTGSGTEKPLSTSLKAVSRPLIGNENAGFLRPDATLSIIIVTDAADQSNESIDYFVNRFRAVKGADKAWLVSVNVVGPFMMRSGCMLDGATDPGRYSAVINATSGVKADICTTSWATELEAVARSSFGARTVFPLTQTPDTSQTIVTSVSGQAASGVSYDGANNAVRFGGQPPAAGTTVSVSYKTACMP